MTEKQCRGCEKIRPISEFYRNKPMPDGHLNYCKTCDLAKKKVIRSRDRKKHREYDRIRNQQPECKKRKTEYGRRAPQERRHARAVAGGAIQRGKLIRQSCEECGTNQRVEAHHDDYSKPLSVRWLCFRHHRETHGQVIL